MKAEDFFGNETQSASDFFGETTSESAEDFFSPKKEDAGTPTSWFKDFSTNIGKSSKRLAGVALGSMNSPLAFVWGSQQAQNIHPDEYKKMPWWKQQLVSIGGGLDSAWRSVSSEGDWGTLYGDYYKGTTGKTIEEDLPNSLKWSAPTVEFLANVISDPLIMFGEASRIASLKVPKHFIKDIPAEVLKDLGRLEKLDAAEKVAVQEKLLNVLRNRDSYTEWWKANLTNAEKAAEGKKFKDPGSYQAWWEKEARTQDVRKVGEPLLTPGGRGIEGLEAPQQAMMGQPKTEFAQKVVKEVPELTKKIKEADMLGKLHVPSSPDAVIAKRKLDIYRKEKGLEPISGMSKAEIKLRKATETLESVNKFRKEKGLPPITTGTKGVYARATGGTILGIEEDDDGNLRYDVAKGIAGAAGAAAVSSILGSKRAARAVSKISKNPGWAKVHDMVGTKTKAFDFAGLLSRISPTTFDRFSKLKNISPATYNAARTYSSYKDQAAIKFQGIVDAFSNVRNDEVVVTDYILAHRAMSRARRGLQNPNNVTFSDAKQAISEIEREYASAGKSVNDLRGSLQSFQKWTHDFILKEALDSGIISKEAYAGIVKNNEWYAAFEILERLPDDLSKVPSMSGEYFSVANQKIIQAMTGTKKAIADPIEATLRKFTQGQAIFERNKVASILIDDPGAKQFFRPVATSKKEFMILQTKGMKPVMEGVWDKNSFDTISRFKEGRVEKYLVDKDIAEAMKQLSPRQAPRVVQAINSVFRKSATTVYLPFTISNASRDALMAYTTAPVYGAGSVGKFAKDWARGFWEGAKHEFLGSSNLAKEYIESGGGFGYVGNLRKPSQAKAKLFKGKIGHAIEVSNPLELLEKISATIELAPRLGVYNRAKLAGASAQDAALMARQSTIDFNRGGTLTKVVNQWVPFLNARVQGRVTVAEALKRDWRGTAAKAVVSTVLPGMATYAWNRIYYSNLYDDIPEHIKQNYFILIIGTEKNDKGKTVPKYLTISKGDLGQMFWNPIEFGIDKMLKKDKEGTTAFVVNYLSDLSPVEFAREGKPSLSKAAGGLIPPIVKGAAEDWANLNFHTGREIVPHYMEKTKPPELQYKKNTPETYKWLGKKLDISPLRLQNFASNIFAGYGREGFDPSAMMRGLTGRLIKTTGGEIENQARAVIEDIEQGYVDARAYALEMVKNGKRREAMKLLTEWNAGLNTQIKKYNNEFKKYPEYKDRGGLRKSYMFTGEKIKNILVPKKGSGTIEEKLSWR